MLTDEDLEYWRVQATNGINVVVPMLRSKLRAMIGEIEQLRTECGVARSMLREVLEAHADLGSAASIVGPPIRDLLPANLRAKIEKEVKIDS